MPELTRKTALTAVAIGLIAGVFAGMFGVGGGFIMVPLFVMWLKSERKMAHATSLAAVVPIALSAAIGYAMHGQVDWIAAIFVLSGSVFGALYGVKLLSTLPVRTLQLVFAALLFISALRLLWSEQPHQLFTGLTADVLLVVIGFAAGVMAGLLGVGGGIVIVPALIISAGLDAATARGTSLAVIIGTGISGTIANVRKGNVDLRIAVVTGLAGIPGTLIGVYLSNTLPGPITVKLFAFLLIGIALKQLPKESH